MASHNGKPIPDGNKWFSVDVLPSHPNPACPGRNVQIVELRGWLSNLEQACNPVDPDWHYWLEVDTRWILSQGIDLRQLFRVGDAYWNASKFNHNGGITEKAVTVPTIHLELFGWRPNDHPNESPPAGWGFSNADPTNCPGVYWPFNPLNPNNGPTPLARGQYLRVVGSLVTDDPHSEQAKPPTFFCQNFGWLCSYNNYLALSNVVSQDWGAGINSQQTDPARWTEIHPPDLIDESLPDPGQQETLVAIAVLSEHCLVGRCASQTVDEDISPPAACQSGFPLQYQELVGTAPNENDFSTIDEGNGAGPNGSSNGAQITVHQPDHIHVHVTVRGRSANGAFGRFFALYRVYCAAPPPPPAISALNPSTVQCGSSQPNQVTITGSNFTSVVNVRLDGLTGGVHGLPFANKSPSVIVAFVPPGTPAGRYAVTVDTLHAGSSTQLPLLVVAPTITGIKPASGPIAGGTSVWVTGTCFDESASATQFSFGNMAAAFPACLSTTQCQVQSPAAANTGAVDIRASVRDASTVITGAFSYTQFAVPMGFELAPVFLGPQTSSVYLNGNASSPGEKIDLRSSDPGLVNVSPSVLVPKGFRSAYTTVEFRPSLTTQDVTLTATYAGRSAPTKVHIVPWPPLKIMAELVTAAKTETLQVTVFMNKLAPPSGAEVKITSEPPVFAPQVVRIPQSGYWAATTIPISAGSAKAAPVGSTVITAAYESARDTVSITFPCPAKPCPKGSFWSTDSCTCETGVPW